MWRLFNFLFGWHYVEVVDCGDAHIRRVKLMSDGILRGRIIGESFYITKDGSASGGYYIESWRPLTWSW